MVRERGMTNQTVQLTVAIARRLCKFPGACEDNPGFLGVRLKQALVLESGACLKKARCLLRTPTPPPGLLWGAYNFRGLRVVDLDRRMSSPANEYLGSGLGERLTPTFSERHGQERKTRCEGRKRVSYPTLLKRPSPHGKKETSG